MNKEALYEFVTGLLDGYEMDDTQFVAFLDLAQSKRENARPWVVLRTMDSSQTANAGDTYTTAKNLPADFKKNYTRFPITLVDGQGNVIRKLREIPLNERDSYKSDNSKFYIDYATKKFYICGQQTQTAYINFYYIKKSTKVSTGSDIWYFDNYDDSYSKILGYDVAVMFKLGVDYDTINNEQGSNNARIAEIMFNAMVEWDNELALSAQQGVDYGSDGNSFFTQDTGNLRNLM